MTSIAPCFIARTVLRTSPNAVTTMKGAHEGQSITLRGRVSTSPNQHLMSGVQDKQEAYFDLSGGEQTVIYLKDPPACSGEIVVTGKVIAVRGQAKGGKGDEHAIEELHVDVATTRCQAPSARPPRSSRPPDVVARIGGAKPASTHSAPGWRAIPRPRK